MAESGELRRLVPQWDAALIAASLGVSLLGAFTSTQLMCQAKMSRHLVGVLVWTGLGSVTFGFCSIWSLHEVAMLAYGLDLRVGIDVGRTVLSAILAVLFTFIALGSDMLYERYSRHKRRSRSRATRRLIAGRPDLSLARSAIANDFESSQPLLFNGGGDMEAAILEDEIDEHTQVDQTIRSQHTPPTEPPAIPSLQSRGSRTSVHSQVENENGEENGTDHDTLSSISRRSSSFTGSTGTNMPSGIGGLLSIRQRNNPDLSSNPFVATYVALRDGLTMTNLAKALVWAIAIVSMHYVGIAGLRVPQGHVKFDFLLVFLSFIICWVVCLVGCVLISEIEVHLGQQLLFSFVATCGVAAMHFTGMAAATFYSYAEPTPDRGYPPFLATAVAVVAISTCLGANLLLSHSATVSRNKLAEIVWTRKKLWMAIAEKQSAESAAAARSEFIASASHEIRTPLHHLTGYSDLLSRTELTEEGRLLLFAIQRATKTLSLITNNVLDYTRLEKGEAMCHPVSLQLRTICENIIQLLPNQNEEDNVELLVVVSPNVPDSLLLDETYIHRILMNLLSNALKFTSSGYILMSIDISEDKLICAVEDTGCGVPTAFLPQLFEPFKQGEVRGTARGTGLGLSIIKQLLSKMQGTIEVETKYQDDVGVEQSGSKFVVKIPIFDSSQSGVVNTPPKIAIFHAGDMRALKGLVSAWQTFGYDVLVLEEYAEMPSKDLAYIWADLPSLERRPQLLSYLLNDTDTTVLIPYDTQASLHKIPGLLYQTPAHIVPIQKPLLLHTIGKVVETSASGRGKSSLPRAVRFDPVIRELEEPRDPAAEPLSRNQSFAEEDAIVQTVIRTPEAEKSRVVLLVEDNPINCKLGKKMLQSLGYQVIIAEDGVEAISSIIAHDSAVDVILMDQSMPRKDGVTTTKEIRAMERNGTLRRTRPIIAVSAVVSAEAQALFKSAGADDFLAKPLSLGRLEASLASYL